MAVFCHYWRLTPEQFWNLAIPEYHAMQRYMARAEEQAERRGRRRR